MGTAVARLTYEPLVVEHAPALVAALGSPQVNRYLVEPEPATVPAAVVHIRRLCAGPPPARGEERWLNFAVLLEGTLVGRLEATITRRHAELAYLFGSRYWGRGLATEAVLWLISHCASAGVDEFWAAVPPENRRSIGLLERLNFAERPPESWPNPPSFEPGFCVFTLCLGASLRLRMASISWRL